MSFTFLRAALRECAEEQGQHYDIKRDRSVFKTVCHDTGEALASWQYRLVEMLDHTNWRMERLKRADGTLRKPRIYLSVAMTSKGNLVLEWFPWKDDRQDFRDTDWLFWSNDRPVGSGMTDNRIVMIHEFENFRTDSRQYTEADKWLALALRSLLGKIYTFLGRFFEVTIFNDLYLEYEDTQPICDRRLKAIRIRSVKDAEREEEDNRRADWLRQTFEGELKIGPERLLELFKECDLKVGKLCVLMGLKHKVKIGETAMKSILGLLYRDFPLIYDSVLAVPPKGVQARKTNVVSITARSTKEKDDRAGADLQGMPR
jgi:hypothetical protein